jgi:hypothetical protein
MGRAGRAYLEAHFERAKLAELMLVVIQETVGSS